MKQTALLLASALLAASLSAKDSDMLPALQPVIS